MRHGSQVEREAMDYLFTSLMQHCKDRGYDGFNLGLVVLSGVYPRLADLPAVVIALVRADSGDRLQDYFGAEFFSMALDQRP
jgi:phosphatidylglycerol lysyltransferase